MEITTLFLVLSIGFYVFLFWRSQLESKKVPQHNRRRSDNPSRPHPRRRASDRGGMETLVLNQLFEDDESDTRHVTNH